MFSVLRQSLCWQSVNRVRKLEFYSQLFSFSCEKNSTHLRIFKLSVHYSYKHSSSWTWTCCSDSVVGLSFGIIHGWASPVLTTASFHSSLASSLMKASLSSASPLPRPPLAIPVSRLSSAVFSSGVETHWVPALLPENFPAGWEMTSNSIRSVFSFTAWSFLVFKIFPGTGTACYSSLTDENKKNLNFINL